MAKCQENLYLYQGEMTTARKIAESIGINKRTLNQRLRKNNYDLSKCLGKNKIDADDITGFRFGRLLITHKAERETTKTSSWSAICDCGNATIVRRSNIVSGATTSCGCFAKEEMSRVKTIHGHSANGFRTRTYKTWASMIERCYTESHIGYHRYGARGISVCERWLESFENFLEDMGERPENKTIDRIDNNGNYHLDNCRWATPTTQNQNAIHSKRWIINGIKYGSAREAARLLNVSNRTIAKWCDGYKQYPPKENCYSEYYYAR